MNLDLDFRRNPTSPFSNLPKIPALNASNVPAEMKNIYILSDSTHIKEGIYKLGAHKGDMESLVNRYITPLPDLKIFCFIHTANFSFIEHWFRKKYNDQRIVNVRGNSSEWYRMPLEEMIQEILSLLQIKISFTDSLYKKGCVTPSNSPAESASSSEI